MSESMEHPGVSQAELHGYPEAAKINVKPELQKPIEANEANESMIADLKVSKALLSELAMTAEEQGA